MGIASRPDITPRSYELELAQADPCSVVSAMNKELKGNAQPRQLDCVSLMRKSLIEIYFTPEVFGWETRSLESNSGSF